MAVRILSVSKTCALAFLPFSSEFIFLSAVSAYWLFARKSGPGLERRMHACYRSRRILASFLDPCPMHKVAL